MYLNYQIIKILGNCFRNINCFQFWSISNIDTATTHLYMVNDNSIFNTKCPEFSTKWYVLFHFHNPTCAYNVLYNLHQKSVTPLLQLFFTYRVGSYLLIKPSLQFPITLSFSIPQQFFTCLFLRTAIPTTYIKSIFPNSAI